MSPPIGKRSKLVRLGVDIMNTANVDHIRSFVFRMNEDGGVDPSKAEYVCLTTAVIDLDAIFATWDYVARVGVTTALKQGLITQGWIERVINKHAKICRVNVRGTARYPRIGMIGRYHNRETGKVNQHIAELEMLIRVRGITEYDFFE